jgi:hypothetical protein
MMKKTFLIGLMTILFITFGIPSLSQGENMIYGCYKKQNGQLRIVNGPSECEPSEIPISWNLIGDQSDAISKTFEYPQGIEGTPVIFEIGLGSTYTVPDGKTLYLTSCHITPYVNGMMYGTDGKCPMFPSSTIIEWGEPELTGFTGILIDNSPDITPVHLPLDNNANTYTVPDGKILVIRSGWGLGSALTINGTAYQNFKGVWVIPSGAVLGTVSSTTSGYTGYLIDE